MKAYFNIRMLALLVAVGLLLSMAAPALAWGYKPSNEDLQDEARLLGDKCIGGTAECIYTCNMRASYSEYSSKVGVLMEGEVYLVTDYYRNSNGRSWIQIDYEGCLVWVSASMVRLNVSDALDADAVNEARLIGCWITINTRLARARSGPGTEYYEVGYVRLNERYVIQSAKASALGKVWYRVRLDNGYGWISSGLAKLDTIPAGAITGTTGGSTPVNPGRSTGGTVNTGYPIGYTCRIIADSGRARSGPDAAYDLVGIVQRGERYQILDYDYASNGKMWYKISIDGVYGWISSGLCEVD